MPSVVWDEITYTFQNFIGATVEVWEWNGDFITRVIGKQLLIHAGIKVNSC